MKKLIEIEFPDGFMPPDEYDWARCSGCPFCHCSDMSDWCAIEGKDSSCPIKRFFKEG